MNLRLNPVLRYFIFSAYLYISSTSFGYSPECFNPPQGDARGVTPPVVATFDPFAFPIQSVSEGDYYSRRCEKQRRLLERKREANERRFGRNNFAIQRQIDQHAEEPTVNMPFQPYQRDISGLSELSDRVSSHYEKCARERDYCMAANGQNAEQIVACSMVYVNCIKLQRPTPESADEHVNSETQTESNEIISLPVSAPIHTVRDY